MFDIDMHHELMTIKRSFFCHIIPWSKEQNVILLKNILFYKD